MKPPVVFGGGCEHQVELDFMGSHIFKKSSVIAESE
jgi:hypothetical protein